jgi:hypothetical protein
MEKGSERTVVPAFPSGVNALDDIENRLLHNELLESNRLGLTTTTALEAYASQMDESYDERCARLAETLAAVRRVHPRRNPSWEDIAAFHDLHADHEFADGRDEAGKRARAR